MLLILSAASYRQAIQSNGSSMGLDDLAPHAHTVIGLRGLLATTDLLKGADAAALDRFRDSADKAGCPCLFLVEENPHPLGMDDAAQAARSLERLENVLVAAQRLGCSSAACAISGPAGSEKAMDLAATRLKKLSSLAERLDLNLLLRPCEGLTQTPSGLTELIKKVGGFRLGSLPDFSAAAKSGDAVDYLRRLAPYAPVVIASSEEFGKSGDHKPFSLVECAETLLSVGYDGAVAVEYRGKGDVDESIRLTIETIAPVLMPEKDS